MKTKHQIVEKYMEDIFIIVSLMRISVACSYLALSDFYKKEWYFNFIK